jgi:hypothetical protein
MPEALRLAGYRQHFVFLVYIPKRFGWLDIGITWFDDRDEILKAQLVRYTVAYAYALKVRIAPSPHAGITCHLCGYTLLNCIHP